MRSNNQHGVRMRNIPATAEQTTFGTSTSPTRRGDFPANAPNLCSPISYAPLRKTMSGVYAAHHVAQSSSRPNLSFHARARTRPLIRSKRTNQIRPRRANFAPSWAKFALISTNAGRLRSTFGQNPPNLTDSGPICAAIDHAIGDFGSIPVEFGRTLAELCPIWA